MQTRPDAPCATDRCRRCGCGYCTEEVLSLLIEGGAPKFLFDAGGIPFMPGLTSMPACKQSHAPIPGTGGLCFNTNHHPDCLRHRTFEGYSHNRLPLKNHLSPGSNRVAGSLLANYRMACPISWRTHLDPFFGSYCNLVAQAFLVFYKRRTLEQLGNRPQPTITPLVYVLPTVP